MNKKDYRQIIYRGQCIDSNDPMRLGRIRAILKTENTTDREDSALNNDVKLYKDWDDKDPFLYKPLLPFFINQPPKNYEYVHLMYSNPDNKGSKDKYYIGGVYSSPTTSSNEPYDSAVTNMELGSRNKPFPNILNEDGEYFNEKSEGIYPNPWDNYLLGRGTADIVVKDNEVILRAGKNKPFKRGEVPEANDQRAFIQISEFTTQTTINSAEEKYRYTPVHQPIKKLIEYNLTNPENTLDIFTGDIYIYNLKPNTQTNTKNFMLSSDVEGYKSLSTTISFSSLPLSSVSGIINDIIKGIIKGDIGEIEIKYSVTISGPKTFDVGLVTPLCYRPQNSLYNKKISGTTISIKTNIINLMNSVKYASSDKTPGYNILYTLNGDTEVPNNVEKFSISPITKTNSPYAATIMGSDYMFFLSHKTQKQGAGKINLSNTIYGIPEDKISTELLSKTSSVVRGEELIELLELIVRYLISHVHPFHGIGPNPQGLDGTKVGDILSELLNSTEKILNKNIRIN